MSAEVVGQAQIAQILDRLDGVRRTRRGWSACCPAHSDRWPSLSIAEGAGGRLLLHCFAGCTYDEITRALGMERAERTLTAPRSTPFALALAIARRQPWMREETHVVYFISDAIRARRRCADRLRRAATAAGDADPAWNYARVAADLDCEALRIEEEAFA